MPAAPTSGARQAPPYSTPVPAGVSLSLPLWTKICVVLGAVLILVGFGGLGAAYAVNQQAVPHTAGSELIRR